MNRDGMLRYASRSSKKWDFIVIGGGATGAGVAVDAVTRGYSVLLLERGDFGSGTSSRSTKLVHGGVRYLRQGHVSLVLEALRERGLLRTNAPHLVQDKAFIVPCYRKSELLYYSLGLKAYDWLAGTQSFGRSRLLTAGEVQRRLPTIRTPGLCGGVLYHDGQFDDARLLIHLLMTAADYGACVLNYAPVIGLIRGPKGGITGVKFVDQESGQSFDAYSKIIVNAAGPFCDEVRRMAEPSLPPILVASQGSHIVLHRRYLPGKDALLIPQTSDGRVLFVIPWQGHTLVGTTDIPTPTVPINPHASDNEIAYLLETVTRYLERPPVREDVLASFAGIRPLLKTGRVNTASMSRDHVLRYEVPGLLTITGGKWTTYRSMAESCVNQASILAGLPRRRCMTPNLRLHGYTLEKRSDSLAVYGADARQIEQLIAAQPEFAKRLHTELPYIEAEIVWSVRFEMARTLTDVLARRTRALLLNTKATWELAPRAAELMGRELNRPPSWITEQIHHLKDMIASVNE